jgi:hypothetical protein
MIAFASNGTMHPDALVVVNTGKSDKKISIRVKGSAGRIFDAFRTSDETDRYASVGPLELRGDILALEAPARSATTLFSR